MPEQSVVLSATGLKRIANDAYTLSYSRTEARAIIDRLGDEDSELMYAFDNAQGEAGDDGHTQYIVIAIEPGVL